MAGYKLKSHRGAAKRFRITGNGKVKRGKAFGKHLLTSKKGKRMRSITAGGYCSDTEARMMIKLLPYS